MSSNQLQPVLKTADQFLEEVSHYHRTARKDELCMVCHEGGDDLVKAFPGWNWSGTWFEELPCCRQPVHHRCLVKHIKGISKHRSKCYHCRETLCIAHVLTPRQQWEAVAEEDMSDYMMAHPYEDLVPSLWMWITMKVYDMVDAKYHLGAPSNGQNYKDVIHYIVDGCGGFYDQHGDDAAICNINRTHGQEWLRHFVTRLMHSLLSMKGAFTEDLENFLLHAQSSHDYLIMRTLPTDDDGGDNRASRLGTPSYMEAAVDDEPGQPESPIPWVSPSYTHAPSSSSGSDQDRTSERSVFPPPLFSAISRDQHRDRQRSRSPQIGEGSRTDRVRNDDIHSRDGDARYGNIYGGTHFHNCTINVESMSNDGGFFTTGRSRYTPWGRGRSRSRDAGPYAPQDGYRTASSSDFSIYGDRARNGDGGMGGGN